MKLYRFHQQTAFLLFFFSFVFFMSAYVQDFDVKKKSTSLSIVHDQQQTPPVKFVSKYKLICEDGFLSSFRIFPQVDKKLPSPRRKKNPVVFIGPIADIPFFTTTNKTAYFKVFPFLIHVIIFFFFGNIQDCWFI